jgi:subtilisin-like proprotein convertase family protein
MARRHRSVRNVSIESIERRLLMAGDPVSDAIKSAIARVADRSQYTEAAIRDARHWGMTVAEGANVNRLKQDLGAATFTPAGLIDDVYLATFPIDRTGQSILRALDRFNAGQFAWPIVNQEATTRFIPNDPQFPNQWHLKNTGQGGGLVGFDANVETAWDNYLGDGVVVGVVDDGVAPTHPDLSPTYRADLSWDWVGGDADPSGGSHGVSVAGVSSAKGNNAVGVSGSAPNSQHAGLKLLGATSDPNVAAALTWKKHDISLYNNSWGPSDSGTVLGGAGPLAAAAMQDAAFTGRNGLGNIFVWACGNGGNNDDVNADSYANSRFTVAVGAMTNTGVRSSYSERGASLLVGAHSNGGTLGITTTSGTSGYTSSFGGTSSASPLAAGVIALMLDANPNLTWRDVQHILVHSAEKVNPADTDWQVNGAGHDINHKYGYGGIDAAAAVALSQTWTNVAPEITATTGTVNVNQAIPNNDTNGISHSVVVGEAIKLETVEIVFNATHTARGQLQVHLTSPSGTQAVLINERPDTGDNFSNWVFTSKRSWDEISQGTWTIRVIDDSGTDVGTFNSYKLNFYGTNAVTSPSVFGTVFDDANGNGSRDGGETGIANAQVFVDSNNDGDFDTGEPTANSTGTGSYSITDLSLGQHVVRAITPAGMRPTNGAQTVNLTAQQNFATNVNFGFVNPRISGITFDDANDNGALNSGETGLTGITVYIDANNNGTLDGGETNVLSGAGGAYSLAGLADGTYVVRAVTPAGRRLTLPGNGAYTATIAAGSLVHTDRNFGLTDRARISGTVYRDNNGNGTRDLSETGIANARVYHDLNNNNAFDNTFGTFNSSDVPKPIPDLGTVESVLNVAGTGSVTNLTVRINITHTWDADLDIFLVSPQGTLVELCTDNGGSGDNFINTVFDDTAATSITAGAPPFTGSFRPEQPLSTLNGQNGNGVWKLRITDDEGALTGTLNSWSISLGTTEPNVVTPADGSYSFAGLSPGTYILRQEPLVGFAFTNPLTGGTTLTASGGDLLSASFGNFPAAYTGSDMTLRLDPTGENVQVWVDEPTNNPPTYTADKDIVSSMSFTGTAGDDSLTVDAINGNPIPSGGVSFDGLGQASAGDVYAIKGTTANEDVLFSQTGASFNGVNVNTTSVERARFDGRGGGDDLLVSSGPNVAIDKTQHLTSLSVTAGNSASVDAGANAVIVTNNIQLTGTFDLADNDMIVNYDGPSQLAAVQVLINSARNGGTWDGPGLTSSSARDHANAITTLGAMESTEYAVVHGGPFNGENPDSTAVLVKYTYYGDTDFNGSIDGDDYARTDSGFNLANSGWINGDFDGNNMVDGDDYALLDAAFNLQGPVL